MVGGTVSNPEKFNVGEHAPFDLVGTTAVGFGAKVVFASSAFATADDTGSYFSDAGAQATVTFEGDGTSELQIFTIPASVMSAAKTAAFAGIPEGGSFVVNVTGDVVNMSREHGYSINGTTPVGLTPSAGTFAAHALWSFPDATEINVGNRGKYDGQFLGTVLVGQSSSVLST